MTRPIWQRLLGPLAPAAFVGVHVEADTCFASAAVPTILGPREVDGVAVPLAGRPLSERIGDIVTRVIARTGRVQGVVLAIPERDVYLETRRLTPGSSPNALRNLDLVSALVPPGGGAAPKTVVQVARRPDPHGGPGLHAVIACRDSVLERLESAVPHTDDFAVNLEPATLAALRASLVIHPASGPATISLRVLAGPRFLAGYLMHGPSPLITAVAPAHELGARARHVLSLIAGLTHHARAYLDLEVREYSAEGLTAPVLEHVGRELGHPVTALEGPGVDGQSVALGLAFGACGTAPAAVHLHRQQRERRRAPREGFPWRDAVAAALSIVTMAFAMEVGARRLNQSIEASRLALPPDSAAATRPLAQLESERDAMAQFLAQWTDFDDRPLSWSRALSSLASVLPDPVKLYRIEGKSPPVPRAGSESGPFSLNVVSPEKPLTLGAILSDGYLKRAFPRVEVSMAVGGESPSGVLYTLIATGQAAVPDQVQTQEAPR